jgi:hypothetical protein
MAGPAFNSNQLIKNIRPDQLDIRKGELSGDLISGGSISTFASTGIKDEATKISLVVKDNEIIVDNITTKQLSGNILVEGNLQVSGQITADRLHVLELTSERTYDKMYLEFQPVDTARNPNGSGLIWKGTDYTKLFVLKTDKFFSSEHIDLHADKSFKIDNVDVLTKNTLGSTIRKSSLREIGTLHHLTVSGDVSLADFVTFSSDQQRISINVEQPVGTITIGDIMQDVIMNIDVDNGRAKIGTYNNRPFDLTAGDQTLVTLDPKGIVSVGHEYKTDTEIRLYGKVGINVKHPEADLDVKGSIRFGNKLFMVYNSPPEKGNYKRGDIVWNESPSVNSPLGWVCIVSGSPGKWASFGDIHE